MRWCCGGTTPSPSAADHIAPLVGSSGGDALNQEMFILRGDQPSGHPLVTTISRADEGNNHREVATQQFYYSPQKQHLYHQLPTSPAASGATPPPASEEGGGRSSIIDAPGATVSALVMDKYGPMLLRPCKTVGLFF